MDDEQVAAAGGAVLLLNALLELRRRLTKFRHNRNGPKTEEDRFHPARFAQTVLRHLAFLLAQVAALNAVKAVAHRRLIFPLTFGASWGLTQLFQINLPLAVPLYVIARISVG